MGLLALCAAGLVALGGRAVAATVSTEVELKAAFASDTQIDVGADIVLTDCTGGGAVERMAAVTDPVTIDGHGHTIRQTCTDNVFVQDGSGLFTVQNLTIIGGHASGNGGGIFAASSLTVTNTAIVNNRADAAGAGIGSQGTVTIMNSTINSNISSGIGGGISLGPASSGVTVTNSTVSNNVGGGIGTTGSTEQAVTVVNSTITGNHDAGLGGGIFSGGSTTLVYATVVDNRANQAFDNIDTQHLESFGSVVAKHGPNVNCLAQTMSHGFNFSDDDTCRFADPTDRENAGDPQLGLLIDNGGLTRTLLPEPGSPLIDAIPPGSCQANGASAVTADQRGVTRPQGPGCDIGAVEVEVPTPPAPPTPVIATGTPRFTG
jgi:hypothetical protein